MQLGYFHFPYLQVNVLDQVKGCEVLTHDGLPVAYALCPTETVRISITNLSLSFQS